MTSRAMPDASDSPVPAGFGPVQALPDELPTDPMPTLRAWYEAGRAARATANPDAMTVATIDADGTPSARIVLCRGIEPEPGYIVFYTNYNSRKSRALDANPKCAAVMHWDAFDRQARLECIAVRSPSEESDAYFATRNAAKRLGAWASHQSEPLQHRDELLERVVEMAEKFGVDLMNIADAPNDAVPRPPHWGGWRLWPTAVELWVGDPARMHDRARWTREVKREGDGFRAGSWKVTRLQP
ncbi:MAG: pyridoxamine 5'-phosphate oxidase [Phycisphaerales bacterium]|nr:pyridoxamine 5'-phosphate oxidase [Phycisphaerales bacterium]